MMERKLEEIQIGEIKPGEIISIDGVRWGVADGFSKYLVSEYGDVFSILRKINIKFRLNKFGYPIANIHYDSGKRGSIFAHRIIALAFIPNKQELPFVNHINGIKTDNAINNLEWCTQQQNVAHAIRTGLTPPPLKGEQHPNSILSNSVVSEIKTILSHFNKISLIDLGKKYNISNAVVMGIKSGKSYSCVSEIKNKEHSNSIIQEIARLIKSGKIRLELNRHAPQKPVLQLDMNGNLVRRWESKMDVAKLNGWNSSNIACVLKRKKISAYGFKWAFAND